MSGLLPFRCGTGRREIPPNRRGAWDGCWRSGVGERPFAAGQKDDEGRCPHRVRRGKGYLVGYSPNCVRAIITSAEARDSGSNRFAVAKAAVMSPVRTCASAIQPRAESMSYTSRIRLTVAKAASKDRAESAANASFFVRLGDGGMSTGDNRNHRISFVIRLEPICGREDPFDQTRGVFHSSKARQRASKKCKPSRALAFRLLFYSR